MHTEDARQLPLTGIKVLDISRVLTGPFCSMILADLGAEVIKVEIPGVGDETRGWGPPFVGEESAYFLSINRNKKSITVNMKEKEGQEIIYKLAQEADVMIENFLPGTTNRLGVDYERIKQVNPNIIYCSISGYGQDGPSAHKPAYDLLIQGEGGLMSITGSKDGEPVRIGVALVDMGAGMYAAIGIMAALFQRQMTGNGKYIDVSLLDTEVSWLSYAASNYFAEGKNPVAMGSAHPSIVPYKAFKAKDRHFILAVGNDAIWQRFCEAMGLDELVNDPKFITNENRVKNREQLEPLIAQIFAQNTAEYWVNLLQKHRIPCGLINYISDVVQHPQVLHRNMVVEMEHSKINKVKMVGNPIHFGDCAIQYRLPPPLLGQHNDEILQQIGYSQDDIKMLKEKGVI